MKKLFMLMILSIFYTSLSFAEGQHDHDHHSSHEKHEHISKKKAIQKGAELIKKLSNKGKIDSTWSGVSSAEAVEKVIYKGKDVWRVAFVNTAANKSQQRLYAYISVEGEIIGANSKKLGKEEDGEHHEDHDHHE